MTARIETRFLRASLVSLVTLPPANSPSLAFPIVSILLAHFPSYTQSLRPPT